MAQAADVGVILVVEIMIIIIMIMIDNQPVKKGEVRGKKSAAEVGVKGATPAWWTNI